MSEGIIFTFFLMVLVNVLPLYCLVLLFSMWSLSFCFVQDEWKSLRLAFNSKKIPISCDKQKASAFNAESKCGLKGWLWVVVGEVGGFEMEHVRLKQFFVIKISVVCLIIMEKRPCKIFERSNIVFWSKSFKTLNKSFYFWEILLYLISSAAWILDRMMEPLTDTIMCFQATFLKSLNFNDH